jgi:hypothetical protein
MSQPSRKPKRVPHVSMNVVYAEVIALFIPTEAKWRACPELVEGDMLFLRIPTTIVARS